MSCFYGIKSFQNLKAMFDKEKRIASNCSKRIVQTFCADFKNVWQKMEDNEIVEQLFITNLFRSPLY